MERGYFNYRTIVAAGRFQERRFLNQWWRFYSGDAHWVPPYYPALLSALSSEHIRRSQPACLSLEALPGPVSGAQPAVVPGQPLLAVDWERPVAMAAVLQDPRQAEALLGLLATVNDTTTLRRLLESAASESEGDRFLGPVALSPYLGAGVLASHWSETPPLDTPYAPPYVAELMDGVMELAAETRLYHLPVPAGGATTPEGPAALHPLDLARLGGDLLPLLTAVYRGAGLFAAPDAAEANFLLGWWGALVPLAGWLAEVGGIPAGFVLLQPDIGPWLQRVRGGRRLWQRFWLRQARRQASRGRVLLGGVAPDLRRRGIGRQLLAASLNSAAEAGWQTLLAGPVAENSAASAVLLAGGAEPRQRYQLFRWQGVSEGWW